MQTGAESEAEEEHERRRGTAGNNRMQRREEFIAALMPPNPGFNLLAMEESPLEVRNAKWPKERVVTRERNGDFLGEEECGLTVQTGALAPENHLHFAPETRSPSSCNAFYYCFRPPAVATACCSATTSVASGRSCASAGRSSCSAGSAQSSASAGCL